MAELPNNTSEAAQLAAQMDKIFGFTGAAEVTGASGKIAHLFESAKAMEMPIGMGTLATLGTAMISYSPTMTAAVGIGAALNGMFSSSKKSDRTPS